MEVGSSCPKYCLLLINEAWVDEVSIFVLGSSGKYVLVLY